MKLDHIGIAVSSIEDAEEVVKNVLEIAEFHREELEGEGIKVSVFSIGDTKMELMEPTKKDSAVARFIEKRGEGIHHIAIRTSDFDSFLRKDLSVTGPRIGVSGRRVLFIHPKEFKGVLLEIVEG